MARRKASASGYRALTVLHHGGSPSTQAGALVPETFLTDSGESRPVDFDRLLELGAIEQVGADDGADAPTDAPDAATDAPPAADKEPTA